MNERIDELYKQSLDQSKGTDHAGNPMLVTKQNPNKFAELIIRECASLAHDDYNDILEHFGIKE